MVIIHLIQVSGATRSRRAGPSTLRAARRFLSVLPLLCLCPPSAGAQWADASQPRGGELRFGLGGESSSFDGRFLPDGSTTSLADVFSVQLDPRLVPALDTLDSALEEVLADLGLPAPVRSGLGRARFDVTIERTRIPFSLEAGLTDWLAASVTVPLVQGKSFVGPVIDTMRATAGPGSSAFGGDANAFFTELDAGIGELESIVGADTLSPDLQSRAENLLADARALEEGLGTLRNLSYLPTDSSAAGAALNGLYSDLRDGLADFEVEAPELMLARPLDASTAGDLASPSRFGLEPMESRDTGLKFGDIELGLSIQPINTFRARPGKPRPTVPIRVRLDLLWRVPGSDPPAPERLTDPGTGDGQADIAVRTTLDVGFGRRFWLSASGGYTIQMDRTLRRLVTSPEAPIQPEAFTSRVEWDPGELVHVLIVPRFNFSRGIVLSVAYDYAHRGRDVVRLLTAPPEGSPFGSADLERGSGYTAQSLGFSLRYAATHWTGDDREGLPIEVELRHRNTISGELGFVPERTAWQVGLRWYVSPLH